MQPQPEPPPESQPTPGTTRRTLVCGALGVVALVTGGYWAWRASSHRAPAAAFGSTDTAESGKPFDFYALNLPDLVGQSQPLARYRGKPLVVNFWATWCAPCVKEMPELDALARRHVAVQFLGVGIDTVANQREFVQKVLVAYPLLVAGYEGTEFLRALGNPAGGLPFTVVFDADGTLHRRILGPVDMDDLAQTLARYG